MFTGGQHLWFRGFKNRQGLVSFGNTSDNSDVQYTKARPARLWLLGQVGCYKNSHTSAKVGLDKIALELCSAGLMQLNQPNGCVTP